MANTPNVGLPTMDPNVLQPSIPFNTAMQLLDAVAQIVVVATANTPPSTTAGDVGKVYLIDSAPTGAWAGRAGQLALCTAPSLWAYLTPRVGWYADIGGGLKRLSSSGWVAVGGGSGDYVNRAGDTMTGQLNAPKVYSSGDLVAVLTAYAQQFQARFAKGQGGQADQTEGWLLQTVDADGNSLGGIYANASGLSLVNNKGGIWSQVQLLNDGQILLNGRSPFPKGQIDGLVPVWGSGTSLSVTSGTCYIPSLKASIEFPGTVTKSGLALSQNTLYYLYAFLSSGTPDIELSITAPDAPYFGRWARTKTGDSSRRYIGAVRTDGSGTLIRFGYDGRVLRWLEGNFSTFRVLANGTSTSQTTINLAPGVPAASTCVFVRATNTAPAGQPGVVLGSNGILNYPVQSGNYSAYIELPCNADQTITYAYDSSPSGGGLYVDIYGYVLQR